MNFLKSLTFFAVVSAILFVAPASLLAGDVKGGTVTVYNSGRALVAEYRTVTLPQGLASVVFKDVPVTLDPTSVRVEAKGMTVRDLQYRYEPINSRTLLDAYLGKELTVIMPDPNDADGRMLRKATVISNDGAPVFMVGDEVYVGAYDALLLPELPKGLATEPTLTLTTDNVSAAKRDVRLSYLMGGLTWRTDYTLELDGKKDIASIDAWATVENSSGRGFSGTKFKLVAGDVQRVRNEPRMYMAKGAVAMESADVAMSAPAPVEESFSEYHVYSVAMPVTMPGRATKQIKLFSSDKVKIHRELTSRFQASVGQRNGEIKQRVDATISFPNTSRSGLGKPMPAGLVRVFMPTDDGSRLLAGEANIGHTGEGGDIELRLGQAFDVKVQRTQVSYRKLGKRSVAMEWRVEVLNSKDSSQAITLLDTYPGSWNVTAGNQKFTKADAGTLEYKLTVPPAKNGAPFVFNYTIQVDY